MSFVSIRKSRKYVFIYTDLQMVDVNLTPDRLVRRIQIGKLGKQVQVEDV
jgi:hypothetical protein